MVAKIYFEGGGGGIIKKLRRGGIPQSLASSEVQGRKEERKEEGDIPKGQRLVGVGVGWS
jgi:hypothetical protein